MKPLLGSIIAFNVPDKMNKVKFKSSDVITCKDCPKLRVNTNCNIKTPQIDKPKNRSASTYAKSNFWKRPGFVSVVVTKISHVVRLMSKTLQTVRCSLLSRMVKAALYPSKHRKKETISRSCAYSIVNIPSCLLKNPHMLHCNVSFASHFQQMEISLCS